MTTQGQRLQKGINAQNWAAMSLFLQYVTRKDFRYIGFEGKKLEDFHLVFEDGRKIICESKAGNINLADIRKILDKVIKHAQVADQDEILIVCKKVNKEAKGLIENFKYFEKDIKKKLKSKKHKFEDKHLKLLPQLRFWEVSQDINRQAVEILMAKVLSYPEAFWVPEHRLQEITKSLVEDRVYQGSQKGETLNRDDFLKLLESKKAQILEDDGYDYEKVKQIEEKEVRKIIKSIKSRSKKLNINNELVKLYANPSIHHFALQKLEGEKNLKLSDWLNLWKATYQSAFSIELFKIFENNIHNKENQEFALNFILSIIGEATNYFREEFIKYDIVKLSGKILELNRALEGQVFQVIKQVYKHSIDKFLYVKRRRDDTWEREKTAELLEELYNKSKNKRLKHDVIDYIVSNFNLVADDGRFWHYTPPSIFKILGKYVSSNPEIRIPWFTKRCVEQYDKFYRKFGKKLKFEGWEHMGSGISQSGSLFSITDRYFVTQILTPSLKKLYEADKEKGLDFIVKKCLSLKDVSRKNPDFLNRATLPILLEEYKGGEFSEEIFEILKTFVKMRKGIPWKNDLIFQGINNDEFTDEQKWKLVDASLKEFDNLPTNVFVEQIVFNIASKPSSKLAKKAGDVIMSWIQNPKYNTRHVIGSYGPTDGILLLLENNFDKAVGLLESYLSTDYFKNKLVSFDAYDVAKAVARVIEKKPAVGIGLLKVIDKAKTLTVNQQIIISGGLYNIPDEKKDILLKVYKEFLKPTLEGLGDIKRIERRFSHRYSRESLVQFAEKLAKLRYFDEALWLVKIFINDSDPILKNYPDDPKGDFNFHQKVIEGDDNPTLNTVRGYCAWVLQKFCIRYGRDYIAEILPLVKQLSKDPNYYVRVQACIPLIELVKNRHTFLSEDSKERFLPMRVAEQIEGIAFAMLKDKENHKLKVVMKHLATVFTYMRNLDEKRAMLVLKTFKNTGFDEVMQEASPLYIFFAEFRSKSFKNWPWGDITKFDSKPFKALLVDLLKNGSSEVKSDLSWQFNRLTDEISKTPKEKSQMTVDEAVALAVSYFKILINKYEHRVFENIYRFIEDYIDSYFEDCFKLWTKCLEVEKPFLIEAAKDKENVPNVYWWPFFYNGKILLAVAKHKGTTEYLKWFEFLADYPIEVLIANDLADAIGPLKKLPKSNKQVARIFNKLIERNPNFLDDKQEWLRQ